MDDILIKIEQATKQYREILALDHVSLEIPRGSITGIVGRNGSGKTVLFRAICGIVKLTEGSITVDGKVIGKDVDILQNVGAIIEHPGFAHNYSAFRNLKDLAMIRGKIGAEEVREVIKRVGLDPDSKKHVGKYSMGMKQRLGIAQAIMENPDILILDEPMNGLDNQGVSDIRKLLLELKAQGKTILLASHNALDIQMLCDYVCELDCGKLVKPLTINNRAENQNTEIEDT